MKELEQLRREYIGEPLDLDSMHEDPVEQFKEWMQEALHAEVPEPHAMILSTVDMMGQPSSRVVLLRGIEEKSFVFFSNYTSRKAVELSTNPQGALLFYWNPLHRQIRIEGTIEMVDPVHSDLYFSQRPRGSQIGAWASPQSATIPDRKALEENVKRLTARFEGQNVPRPSFWGGYRLVAKDIEFWQGRENRLHDRLRYRHYRGAWKAERLAP